MDNGSVLNLERMWSCSRKACQYMLLYKAVEMLNLVETNGTVDSPVFLNKHSILEGSMKLYWRLKKTKRSHWSVLDDQITDIWSVE